MSPSNILGSPRTSIAGLLSVVLGFLGQSVVPALATFFGAQPGPGWKLLGTFIGLLPAALMPDASGKIALANIFAGPRTTLAGALGVLVGLLGQNLLPALVQFLGQQPGPIWQILGLTLGAVAPAFMADVSKKVSGLAGPAIALLIGGSLLLAAPARADDPAPVPHSLCMIGTAGNWCYGLLPSVSVIGIDVKHGNVVAGLSVGTSLAGTWMPGQLKSVTLGIHAGLQSGSADVPQTANLGATVSLLKGWLTIIADWQAIGGSHGFVIAPALNPLAAF